MNGPEEIEEEQRRRLDAGEASHGQSIVGRVKEEEKEDGGLVRRVGS